MHPSHYAKASPNKPAFILASTGETVTYAQLEKRSNQIAQLFRSLGLKPDDHIAIHMENNRHFMEIVWGAQRSGIIYTAISTHLREDEIAYIVDNCEAKLLISSSKLGDLARNIRSRCSGLQHCFMVGDPLPGYASWEETTKSQSDLPITDEERGVQMLYSSGTTGQPKGILPKRVPGDPITVMTVSYTHLTLPTICSV